MVNTLLKTLELCRGRMDVPSVFEILENEFVQKKFGLWQQDLSKLKLWMDQAMIRWGVDGKHHQQFTGVCFDDYSWNSGLRRLLLGYAMFEPDSPDGFESEKIIPADFAEDSETLLLDRFLSFIKILFQTWQSLKDSKSPSDWEQFLQDLLNKLFFQTREIHEELVQIREILFNFRLHAEEEGISNPLDAGTVLDMLSEQFELTASESAFLREKITFCSLVPLRTIPRKVIAVMGLNEQDFPRRDHELLFNLLSSDLKKRYCSKSMQDRYLFLETILAAEKQLILSYTGQDVKSRETKPPAVPLQELISYVSDHYSVQVIQEKLQAFSPDYFSGENPALYSYSAENFHAAQMLERSRSQAFSSMPPVSGRETARLSQEVLQILKNGIKDPENIETPQVLSANLIESIPNSNGTVELQDFCHFFQNASAIYLETAAGIVCPSLSASEEDDTEPFAPDPLESYDLYRKMTEFTAVGFPLDIQQNFLEKTLIHLLGENSSSVFSKIYENIQFLFMNAPEARQLFKKTSRKKAVSFFSTTAHRSLHGNIPFLLEKAPSGSSTDNTLTAYLPVYSDWKGKYAFRLLAHMSLASAGLGIPCAGKVLLFKKREIKTFHSISPEDASLWLNHMLLIYSAGHILPLPIFEKTSWNAACQTASGKQDNNKLLEIFLEEDCAPGKNRADTQPIRLLYPDPDIFKLYPDQMEGLRVLAEHIYLPLLSRAEKKPRSRSSKTEIREY